MNYREGDEPDKSNERNKAARVNINKVIMRAQLRPCDVRIIKYERERDKAVRVNISKVITRA